MTKRRGHGEGSITERVNKDGETRYRAQLRLPGGKRLSHTVKTKREAQTWLRKTTSDAEQGILARSGRMTVEQYLAQWLEAVKPTLRPLTIQNYAWYIKKYINPNIGNIRLSLLQPEDVQALYSRLLEKGLSSSTVRQGHVIIHRALVSAVKWRLLGRNVADFAEPPKIERKEMQIFTAEEVRCLLDAAEGEWLYCFFVLAVSTGMRRGELLALKWPDIDFDEKVIRVTRTVARTKDGYLYGEPKTASGRRQIALSDGVISAVKHRQFQIEWRLSCGDWVENDLVFPSQRGTPLTTHSLVTQFERILKLAGLPHISIHGLRHTSASLMLAQGTHPKVVQERLGHSKIGITLDLYSHTIPDMQREAADILGDKIGLK